jgi:hypothetical protein
LRNGGVPATLNFSGLMVTMAAFSKTTINPCVEGPARPWKAVAEDGPRDLEVVVRLEAQPELLGRLEVASEPERRVGRDPALAPDDLMDATRGNAEVPRDAKPRQAQRLEELQREDLAGMKRS